jgi:hypothetical protein
MSYAERRAFSDQYLGEIKRIIGPLLLEPASLEMDQRQATDLLTLNARDLRIGARVRSSSYAEKYPYQFTIRSQSVGGAETELDKIRWGWCDWLFYGHAVMPPAIYIGRWMVLNLNVFRGVMWEHGIDGARKRGLFVDCVNGDGGTGFIACDVRRWPPQLLIATSFDCRNKEAAA